MILPTDGGAAAAHEMDASVKDILQAVDDLLQQEASESEVLHHTTQTTTILPTPTTEIVPFVLKSAPNLAASP